MIDGAPTYFNHSMLSDITSGIIKSPFPIKVFNNLNIYILLTCENKINYAPITYTFTR